MVLGVEVYSKRREHELRTKLDESPRQNGSPLDFQSKHGEHAVDGKQQYGRNIVVQKAPKNNPQLAKAELLHARGFAFRKEGKFDAAVEQYTEAIQVDPGFVL